MRLECPDCLIRDWSPGDRDALVRVANNRTIWRNLTHLFPHPYTETDADAWFARLTAMEEPTHWAIEVDGQAAGGIGVVIGEGVYSRSGELGYWLGEPYWGRGIMTQAVRAVTPYVMTRFDLCRLEAGVFSWNPASMRVLERCGFVREGVSRAGIFKDGEIIDQVVYALVDRSAGGRMAGELGPARTTAPHTRSFDRAPRVHRGELVRWVRDDERNPGWFLGAAADGTEGYFPGRWFAFERDRSRARALRDYDGMELTIEVGVDVERLAEESGWVLVLTADGRRGWVPSGCLG